MEHDLQKFKDILDKVGHTISANKYDGMKIPKISRRALERKYKCSWAELKSKVLYDQDAEESNLYLAEQNRFLLGRLEREKDKTEAFINLCLANIAKLKLQTVAPPKKHKTKEDLQFHLVRSDAQVGEKIEPRSTGGMGEYNLEIYKQRHNRLIQKVMLFKEQDSNLGLNKLIIEHLGDQVEGESIYPGQPFYLDAHLVDQLFESVATEASGLLTLAKEFREIEVFCVSGNHGRIGKKGQHSTATNFDYLFYRMLQQVLKQQKNIKIYVSESPSMVVQFGKFNFLLNHGDATKSWGGIPFYGLERMYRRLPGLYGIMIHFMMVGHFHQPSEISEAILVNGCFPGGSDLSINKMQLKSRPIQKIFYFHDELGINRKSDIYLADIEEVEADVNGIYTPYIQEAFAG